MKIEVLISTMYQNDYSILEKMNIESNAVVINQCERNYKSRFKYKNYNILWIDTVERGLSRSRNMAIAYSTAEICILADDDEEFVSNYAKIVEEAFENNSDFQILRFKVNGIEKSFKKYPERSYEMRYLKSLKISSVEIAFKRECIIKNSIEFDTLIGAGTKFPMGEENSFLFQCLRKKIKIKYIPHILANLHIGNSTWFTGFDKRYFIGRGAAFTSMSKKFAPILIIQFAIRKQRLYCKELSVWTAIKYMFQGRKQYLLYK